MEISKHGKKLLQILKHGQIDEYFLYYKDQLKSNQVVIKNYSL